MSHTIKLQVSFYRNTKDKTQILNQSFAVYNLHVLDEVVVILVKQDGLYMKERKNMLTLTRRAKNKVQFVNICQLGLTIVT